MPERRHAVRFGRIHTIVTLLYTLVGLGGMVYFMFSILRAVGLLGEADPEAQGIELLTGPRTAALAVFAGSFVFGVAFSFIHPRRFRCPQCGARVRRSGEYDDRGRREVIFHCTGCEIEWDAGFRTGGGDGND